MSLTTGNLPASEPVDHSATYDQAANLFLGGIVLFIVLRVVLAFVSEEVAYYVRYDAVVNGSVAVLVLLALTGLFVIYDPPNRVVERNLRVSAWLMFAAPFFVNAILLVEDEPEVYLLGSLGQLVGYSGPLLIFALLALRYRKSVNRSPVFAVAGLLMSVPLGVVENLWQRLGERLGLGGAAEFALGTTGSVTLLLAAGLVLLAPRNPRLMGTVRSAGVAAALSCAGSLVITFLIALTGEADRYRFVFGSPVPRSLVMLTAVAVLVVVAKVVHSAPQTPPRSAVQVQISLGWTIAWALFFWPIGIVAISLAARSLTAAEAGEPQIARQLAEAGIRWRTASVGVGLLLAFIATALATA